MSSTIIRALLPIVVTLLVGFLAAWRHDFDGKHAAVLNRMVTLYAMPLNLLAGMLGMDRSQILAQDPLVLGILVRMAGAYAVVFFACWRFMRADITTSALRTLAISCPSVPFVGVSVLGDLFGSSSAVPISVASLVMNLTQVPATLMLLSAGRKGLGASEAPSLGNHILHALREPVVWAPLFALLLVLADIRIPGAIADSLTLLATGGVALFASGIVLYSRQIAFDLAVGLSVVARNIAIQGRCGRY